MQKKHTVGNISALIMLLIAAGVDAAQFFLTISTIFLPLSWMLSIMAITGFMLWFAIAGVKYLGDGGKKLLLTLAAGAAEFIPIINAIPAVTASVLGTIVMTRIEDARRSIGKTVVEGRSAQAAGRLAQMRARRGAQGPGVARAAGTVAKFVPAARAVTTAASVGSAVMHPRPANNNAPNEAKRAA